MLEQNPNQIVQQLQNMQLQKVIEQMISVNVIRYNLSLLDMIKYDLSLLDAVGRDSLLLNIIKRELILENIMNDKIL